MVMLRRRVKPGTLFPLICFYLPVICNRNIMIKTVIKRISKDIEDAFIKRLSLSPPARATKWGFI